MFFHAASCSALFFLLLGRNPPKKNGDDGSPEAISAHSAVDKPAWIFLMEMVKGGSYGLDVLPPLVMYNAGGTLGAQALAYYDKSKEQAK